ncbi:MAG: lipoate--protein ligase family protein [Planctomycetes bacterium]|nr:lipoate--protein ligase family protein [Planctomycetota bacterium]
MTEKLRLLPLITADGASQMALDEALLDAARGPTLRIYRWAEPTVSLGYFQDHGSVVASLPVQDPPRVVRRITGGGAIWHEHEVTYCLVANRGMAGVPADTRALYAQLHGEVLEELAHRGAALDLQRGTTGDRRYRDEPRCFASPAENDLVASAGGKALGSAARTRGARILVHGSLKLASNRWDLGAVAACGLSTDDAVTALITGLARAIGVEPSPGDISAEETAARDRILQERYATSDWVQRRIGPRP